MSFYTPPRRSRRTLTITDLEILTTFDYWAHHKIHNLRMRRRDKIDILVLGTPDAAKHIRYTHALKHKIIAIAISGLIVHYDKINPTLRSSSPSIHTHIRYNSWQFCRVINHSPPRRSPITLCTRPTPPSN